MNLKEQLYVTTLARCKTISRASEELFISQSALSVYIRNLEKYLGTDLFVRTGKEFQLTYIGREYVRRAEKMLQMKQEFDQIVHDLNRKYEGRIRIGLQPRRAVALLPEAMAEFMKEYPDVELVIRQEVHADLVEMYEKNQIDLFVGVYKGELTDAEYVTISHDHMLIALPADHPANLLASRTAENSGLFPRLDIRCLNGETFILPPEAHSLRASANRILEEYQVMPGKIIEMSYFETILALVEHGIGVAFNRESYLGGMRSNQKLNYYRVGDPDYSSRIVIAHRKGRIPAYTERMIELLAEQSRID